MTLLHRTIFIALFLSPVTGSLAHFDPEADKFGYATSLRLIPYGWSGAKFAVKTPFYTINKVLISITLFLKTEDGQLPEDITCSLRKDYRYVPTDLHSVPGLDADLGLFFEQLEPHSEVDFTIVWKNKPGLKAIPHSGIIQVSGPDWKSSSNNEFGPFAHDKSGIPVHIIITGPEDCRLM